MQRTLDLALELNCEFANFYSAMAYPGSPLYEQALALGWRAAGEVERLLAARRRHAAAADAAPLGRRGAPLPRPRVRRLLRAPALSRRWCATKFGEDTVDHIRRDDRPPARRACTRRPDRDGDVHRGIYVAGGRHDDRHAPSCGAWTRTRLRARRFRRTRNPIYAIARPSRRFLRPAAARVRVRRRRQRRPASPATSSAPADLMIDNLLVAAIVIPAAAAQRRAPSCSTSASSCTYPKQAPQPAADRRRSGRGRSNRRAPPMRRPKLAGVDALRRLPPAARQRRSSRRSPPTSTARATTSAPRTRTSSAR